MGIVFIFTHEMAVTFYVGLFEFFSKVTLFYLHERAWLLVLFKRRKKLQTEGA
jgi:adenylylsulfate kinase